jgi:hypothetical protein
MRFIFSSSVLVISLTAFVTSAFAMEYGKPQQTNQTNPPPKSAVKTAPSNPSDTVTFNPKPKIDSNNLRKNGGAN